MPSPFVILGISSSASRDEIRKAYHRLALAHHPDRKSTKSDDMMMKINTAYEEALRLHDAAKNKPKPKTSNLGHTREVEAAEKIKRYRNLVRSKEQQLKDAKQKREDVYKQIKRLTGEVGKLQELYSVCADIVEQCRDDLDLLDAKLQKAKEDCDDVPPPRSTRNPEERDYRPQRNDRNYDDPDHHPGRDPYGRF